MIKKWTSEPHMRQNIRVDSICTNCIPSRSLNRSGCLILPLSKLWWSPKLKEQTGPTFKSSSLADFLWRPNQHLDSSQQNEDMWGILLAPNSNWPFLPELVWHLVTYHAFVPHSFIPPARMKTLEGLQFQDIPPIEALSSYSFKEAFPGISQDSIHPLRIAGNWVSGGDSGWLFNPDLKEAPQP